MGQGHRRRRLLLPGRTRPSLWLSPRHRWVSPGRLGREGYGAATCRRERAGVPRSPALAGSCRTPRYVAVGVTAEISRSARHAGQSGREVSGERVTGAAREGLGGRALSASSTDRITWPYGPAATGPGLIARGAELVVYGSVAADINRRREQGEICDYVGKDYGLNPLQVLDIAAGRARVVPDPPSGYGAQ
jgi:hypothetical protein